MESKNIIESATPYEVLRRIHDGEPVEISDLTEMEEKGYIVREDDSFKISRKRLKRKWIDIWEKEVEEEIRVPTNFEDFLKYYTESYLENEENSTIRRMLKDDFLAGLKVKEEKNGLPKSLEEMRQQLEENYDRNHHTCIHVKNGMNNIEMQ